MCCGMKFDGWVDGVNEFWLSPVSPGLLLTQAMNQFERQTAFKLNAVNALLRVRFSIQPRSWTELKVRFSVEQKAPELNWTQLRQLYWWQLQIAHPTPDHQCSSLESHPHPKPSSQGTHWSWNLQLKQQAYECTGWDIVTTGDKVMIGWVLGVPEYLTCLHLLQVWGLHLDSHFRFSLIPHFTFPIVNWEKK